MRKRMRKMMFGQKSKLCVSDAPENAQDDVCV